MPKLSELLNIQKGVTAIIGAGGKTSLIKALTAQLKTRGNVIVATTTKIYPMEGMINLIGASASDIQSALAKDNSVCVGEAGPQGKLVAPLLSMDALADLADYVLVEADGAKRKPVKAHRPTEPVVPESANQTVLVVGLSAVGQTISNAAHCPELFAARCGLSVADVITPEAIARVINFEKLHDRVFINYIEGEFDLAEQIAKNIDCPVVAGSHKTGVYKCLS